MIEHKIITREKHFTDETKFSIKIFDLDVKPFRVEF